MTWKNGHEWSVGKFLEEESRGLFERDWGKF
jgi:hypothetical protein